MIEALRTANVGYEKKIAFVYVDWDKHRRSKISKDLGVFRQSILVMLTDKGEVGRLVAQTSEGAIKRLLDTAPDRKAGAPSCNG